MNNLAKYKVAVCHLPSDIQKSRSIIKAVLDTIAEISKTDFVFNFRILNALKLLLQNISFSPSLSYCFCVLLHLISNNFCYSFEYITLTD